MRIKKSNRWPGGAKDRGFETREVDAIKSIDVKRIGPGSMAGETDCPHNRARSFSVKAVDLVFAIFWTKEFLEQTMLHKSKMRTFLQVQDREQMLRERASLQMVVEHEARAIAARRSAVKHVPTISAVRYQPPTVTFSASDLRVQLAESPAYKIRQTHSSKRTQTTKRCARKKKDMHPLQLKFKSSIPKSKSEPLSLSLPKIQSFDRRKQAGA
jgi:CRP-like cAMP-binding protein